MTDGSGVYDSRYPAYLLLVRHKPKARPKAERDFTGVAIAQLGKKGLRDLVFGIRVDSQKPDAPLNRYCLRLRQQGHRYALTAKGRIDRQPVGNDGPLTEVEANLCVFGFLVFGEGCCARKLPVYISDPKLAFGDVLTENGFVGVVVVPLKIASLVHERNNAPKEIHQIRYVGGGSRAYRHGWVVGRLVLRVSRYIYLPSFSISTTNVSSLTVVSGLPL